MKHHPGGYRLQILDPEGHVALSWPAGHPIEADLAGSIASVLAETYGDAIALAAIKEGIGLFRSEAHVAEVIRAASTAVAEQAVRAAVVTAVRALKADIHPNPPPITRLK